MAKKLALLLLPLLGSCNWPISFWGFGNTTKTEQSAKLVEISTAAKRQANERDLPDMLLTSPFRAIFLEAATDTIFLPPETSNSLPVLPVATAIKATVQKSNGEILPAEPGILEWSVSDTTRATVTNDGMVKAASSPGEVVVTAKIRASPAISTQTIIQVKDPGAFADVRILGLGYTP